MNASTLLSALQWAEYTFGSVHLGDQRRTERAVEIASAIAHHPAASLPAQMQDEAATEAAYRFLQMPDVTYEKLIGPHVAQTRAHASKQQQVLLMRQQQCDFVVRAAQDRCVDLPVEQADAPVPPRSHHPRRAGQEAEPKPQHLFEVVRGWSAVGEQDLCLDATKQSKARVARVVISFGCLRLLPPQHQPSGALRPLVVWVVRVWEPEPPEGVEGLEWVLLTSVPTAMVEQAWQRVDWYRARWIVEDYHQGLKTGCSIELRQLQSYEALRRLLGLLAPAAVRLLQLRTAARDAPERLASEILPLDLVQVVALLVKVPVPAAELTAQQCWYTIARYGGYLRRRSGGPPGWKTLWKGWFYIQALLEGVHLATRLSLD
jgi:Transposase DNA-binding/Transposase Tn5 dimerisation domain